MTLQALSIVTLLAPLAGFAVALVLFRRRHELAAWTAIASGAASLAGAVALATRVPAESADAAVLASRWFVIGDVPVYFGLYLDGLTAIMGVVVALITLCIMVYSLAYMRGDPGRGRFFAFLALFEWSMLAFVYAPSILQTFIFWELVGLASFLLIGFWYEKPSAVAAAKKAFIMTRIGDVGLFVGMILLFREAGTLELGSVLAIFGPEGLPEGIAPGRIELIAALLFVGVIGKSAQFPLHTWLPDAMEGPTPVSALLHSATMVAAGVFLVARLHGLFLDAPDTMSAMLWIATFTALLASTMAITAKDMKRVLAFSSVSQLSFMLIGLAAGSLFAGFFHLTTHALFKALLFLCAGSFIHAAGSNDLVAIGRSGAARRLPVTTIGLVAGSLALAGIPPLAGFFSKEQILGALHADHRLGFQIAATAAALLTAYYTFRMVLLIVRPNPDSRADADEPAGAQHPGGHPHGPAEPWSMRAPIALLTLGALGAGFLGDRIGHAIGLEHVHHPSIAEMAPAVVVALLGVALAWFDFGRRGAPQTGVVALVPPLERLFVRRWYIDEIYRATFVRASVAIARVCFSTETRGLDGAADGVARGTAGLGWLTARLNTGAIQVAVGVAVVFVAALAVYLGLGLGPA
jgi:NADH-quinone oxidoreductase subunit L